MSNRIRIEELEQKRKLKRKREQNLTEQAERNLSRIKGYINAWKIGEGGIRQDLDEVESQGKFESCIGCGSCTGHCPQNIAIPDIMAQLKEKFG